MKMLANMKSMVGTDWFWTLAGILLVIIILIFSLLLVSRRKNRESMERLRKALIDSIYESFRPNYPAEQSWNEWLVAISKVSPANNYYFYQCDPMSGNMFLRAVRSSKQAFNIGLNANLPAGVISDAKQYRPPLMLNSLQTEEQIKAVAGDKKFTLLWLKSEKEILGMIQVGPPHGKWNTQMLAIAQELCLAMVRVQKMVLERIQMEKKVKEAVNMSQAATLMRQSSTGSPQFLKQLMDQMLSSLCGDAVYMLKTVRPDSPEENPEDDPMYAAYRLTLAEAKGLTQDDRTIIGANVNKLPGDLGRLKSNAQFRREGDLLEEPYCSLVSGKYKSMISVPLWANDHFWGLLVVLAKEADALNARYLPAAVILTKRIAMTLENGLIYKEMTQSYIDTLKALVDYDDSLEPYTQGHSRQIACFAQELAAALGQNPEFIEAVYLAGYLHDVGMSGFLRQMATKQGNLTDQEMEQVRHHSNRGAILVESISEPIAIAPFIKHHHERWDGMGYPDGLQGEQIPLGARILSVVDFLCAKLTARNYRPAIPLKRALAEMEKAAGAQLDPHLVEIYVNLWRKKAVTIAQKKIPETRCYNLLQCPDFLMHACAACQQPTVNCWDTKGIICSQHGDSCETCLVHTAHMLGEEMKLSIADRQEAFFA